MKNLCHCKYQQETSEQAYNLLQQKIAYYASPDQSIGCSPIFYGADFDSIQNIEMHRPLLQHYKEIAEQARSKMFQLYLQTAEEERNTCRTNYDAAEKKMWTDRRLASDDAKISPIMVHLIEQRCKKISDRIKCTY